MSEHFTKRMSPAICPEAIARKIAAIQNLEYPEIYEQVCDRPKLLEMLWFLQEVSTRPGGLNQFTQNLVNHCGDSIGTPSMRDQGVPPGGKYEPARCLKIWQEIPYAKQTQLEPESGWFLDLAVFNACLPTAAEQLRKEKDFASKVSSLDHAYFRRACEDTAVEKLPDFFARICNIEAKGFIADSEIWFMSDVFEAVFRMMDFQAAQSRERLATTAVTVKVFDALDYALAESCMVLIEGDTRFGKTESIQTWCAMRPGRARLVTVPCSNSDLDLFKAVADALGIQYGRSPSHRLLKDKVEFVIRYSRLMLVFDEFHFAFPQRYAKTTAPMRLNWIRTQIVDRKLPCAFVATPQTYRHGMKRFVETTGHNIDQFLGRNLFKLILPNELSTEDLLAVAKVHFPALDEDYLLLIASKAMQSESYLLAVESIAKRARYLCGRDGRRSVRLKDIETAISEIFPNAQKAQKAPPRKPLAEGLQNACKRKETAIPSGTTAGRKLEFSASDLRPSGNGVSADLISSANS